MRTPLVFFLALAALATSAHAAEPIGLVVDARDVALQRVHVTLSLTVTAGTLTLDYPKWIPGMHEPVGPVKNVTNLSVQSADGGNLPWRRDSFDAYGFKVEVPNGVRRVFVAFDYLPRRNDTDEVAYGVAASDNLAVLNWNAFLLIPRGTDVTKATVAPQLLLPQTWKLATALRENQGELPETTIERLIDSPVFAGEYLKTIELAEGTDITHTLAVIGDDATVATPPAHVVTALRKLVVESGLLFGARHYRRFVFLLALTNRLPSYGLEHHASSVNVLRPTALGDGTSIPAHWNANLLPHEFVHSWNGKFRRPQGLVATSYNQPLSTDLLWVYEGLTEYLGEVLMVRSGFLPLDAERDHLYNQILSLDRRKARTNQSLRDAASTFGLISQVGDGERLRFSNDLYYESALHWLEADTIIRQRTQGAQSLDTFCRIFFGGANQGPEVRGYDETDLVGALRRALPNFDWVEWLNTRFGSHDPRAPRAGLENSGWKDGFGEVTSTRGREAMTNYRHSLGLQVSLESALLVIEPDSLAAKAGLAVGDKLLGIDGKVFSLERLRDAVRTTRNRPGTIELLVQQQDAYRTVRLSYSGGEKLPVLVRATDRPDLLTAIFTPLGR